MFTNLKKISIFVNNSLRKKVNEEVFRQAYAHAVNFTPYLCSLLLMRNNYKKEDIPPNFNKMHKYLCSGYVENTLLREAFYKASRLETTLGVAVAGVVKIEVRFFERFQKECFFALSANINADGNLVGGVACVM